MTLLSLHISVVRPCKRQQEQQQEQEEDSSDIVVVVLNPSIPEPILKDVLNPEKLYKTP